MKKYKLGFIGCGNMAKAIIGCLNGDSVRYLHKLNKVRFDLYGYDADAGKVGALTGVTPTESAAQLVSLCDFVFLSVKPQNAQAAVEGVDFTDTVVISIMAGVSLDKLEEMTRADKLVRVMPNLNARVGSSFNAYCARGLDEQTEYTVKLILDSFGETVKVEEREINAVTGLAGSGPAFVFMFIKAFIDEGIRRGFDRKTARKMALATIIGSAYNIEENEAGDIDALIDSVCSKGGTTIQGVNYLNEQAFCQTVGTAIERAIARAEEMERGE